MAQIPHEKRYGPTAFRSCHLNHRQAALSFPALGSSFLVRLSDLALACGAPRRICPCRSAKTCDIRPLSDSSLVGAVWSVFQ